MHLQVIVPLHTPCNNGEVDYKSLHNLAEYTISNDVDAIFHPGKNGEFEYLTLEEKVQTTKVLVRTIRKRIPLFVGIAAPTIEETLTYLDQTKKEFIDAVVIAPSFPCNTPPSTLIEQVLKHTKKPILLYNNPEFQEGENIPPTLIKELARKKQVIGIKDSSGNHSYFDQLLELQRKGFTVFQGSEKALLERDLPPTTGCVAGTANYIPQLFQQLYTEQNPEKLRAICEQILTIKQTIKTRDPTNYIAALKQALATLGIITSAETFADRKIAVYK